MFVFSHGFGVAKDARGMFCQIAAELGPQNCVLFDYNQVSSSGDITVADLNTQTSALGGVISSISEPVDLICHSQGCLVAALLVPEVRSALLLAPASTTTSAQFAAKFSGRKGAKLDFAGTSVFPRSDGTKTFVGPEYWKSLDSVGSADELYARFACATDNVYVIEAGGDKVVDSWQAAMVSSHQVIAEADHDFTGPARPKLLAAIKQCLVLQDT